jgi:ATP-binding cassette, subfamily B, bacterial
MTHAAIISAHLGRRRRPEEPASWNDRLAALRYVPALFRLIWETHRGYAASMVVFRVLRSFVPVATFWVGKLILDSVIAAKAGHTSLTQLWRYLVLEIAIVLVGELLARASSLIESLLGDLFSNAMSVRLMEHAARLDLAQFEDPEFYDHLERARRQTVGRIALLTLLLSLAQDALTLLTLAGALIAYSPWLLLLLAVAVVPSFLGETHFASLGYSLLFRWTPERRQLDYLRYVGASDVTAKEVQMFGLAPWVTERYATLSQRFYEENRDLSVRRSAVSAVLSILGTVGYYAAYVIILLHAVRGDITIGMLTFLAASFGRGRDVIQSILLSASNVFEQALYLRDLFVFLDMKPTIESPPNARAVPKPIQRGFAFENVGFRYPGSERWAVRNVDMTLKPGERVALVGENGAGKTTITKLIARLYDPTEGRITLDGHRPPRIRSGESSTRHRSDLPGFRALRYEIRRKHRRRRDRVRARGSRPNQRHASGNYRRSGEFSGRVTSPQIRQRISTDARQTLRRRRRSVGRRVAEDCSCSRVYPRRPGAHPRRANRRARCPRRIRSISTFFRARRRTYGDPDLAQILDRANGRSHHRAAVWQG